MAGKNFPIRDLGGWRIGARRANEGGAICIQFRRGRERRVMLLDDEGAIQLATALADIVEASRNG